MLNQVNLDFVPPIIQKVKQTARNRQSRLGALMLVEAASKQFFIDIDSKIPFLGVDKFEINFTTSNRACPDMGTGGAIACNNNPIGASNLLANEVVFKVTEKNFTTISGAPIIFRTTDFETAAFQYSDGTNSYGFDLDKKNRKMIEKMVSSIEGMLLTADQTILNRLDALSKSGCRINGQTGAFQTNFITRDDDNGGSPTIQRNAFLALAMEYEDGYKSLDFDTDISLLLPSNYAKAISNLLAYETMTNAGVKPQGTTNPIANAFTDSYLNRMSNGGTADWHSATVPKGFAVDSSMYAVKFVSRNRQAVVYDNRQAEIGFAAMVDAVKEFQKPFGGRNAQMTFTMPYPLANGEFSYIPIDVRIKVEVDCNDIATVEIIPMMHYIELMAPNTLQCGLPPAYNGIVAIVGNALPAIATAAPSTPFTPVSCTAVTGATFPLAVGCNSTGYITFTNSLGNAVSNATTPVSFPAESLTPVLLANWLNYALSLAVPSVPYGSFTVNTAGTGIQFCHTNLPTRIVVPGGTITLNITGLPPVILTVA